MAGLKVPIFLLRGDGETGQKKVYVGEASLYGEQEGFFDTGLITEQLYLEHPDQGDVEIKETVRFIIGL